MCNFEKRKKIEETIKLTRRVGISSLICSGAPNDGFLLKTLKKLSSFLGYPHYFEIPRNAF